MTEESISRRVLPIMLGISTSSVCTIGIINLSYDFFNPRPYEPFCTVGPYPHNCLEDDNDVECIRGGNLSYSMAQGLLFTCLISGLLFLISMMSSMVVVVVTVFKTELAWRQNGQRRDDVRNPSRTSDFNNTRTALRQALMYIAAFVLTWIWLCIALISPGKPWNDYLKMFFQPLQGFFNAAIFFTSKVHVLRKSKPDLTRWQALGQVLMSPWTVPLVVVSHIDIVNNENDDDPLNVKEVNYNDRIKRTGILRSDMPPLSIVSSNITPSLDPSLAMSTKDIMVVKDETKGKEPTIQDDIPPLSPHQVQDIETSADFEVQEHDTSNPNLPSNKSDPCENNPRRSNYQWPPPPPSSLSSRSNDGKMSSLFLGTSSRRGGTSSCGAGAISQHSRNQGEDEEDKEDQTTSERDLSGFSCDFNDEKNSNTSTHSQERQVVMCGESSSVSQAVNFDSSFMRSSMNLAEMDDVSISGDLDSNSSTSGGISYSTP